MGRKLGAPKVGETREILWAAVDTRVPSEFLLSRIGRAAVMELVRFLLSRIADDMALAPDLHSEKCRLFVGSRDWTWCDCGYPARASSEVQAKRRIVEAAPKFQQSDDGKRVFVLTLRLLALPYAGHPDYQQEWRP